MELIFITGNDNKIQTARAVCDRFGIYLHHKNLDIPEIQAEDGNVIAKDKARQAFEILHESVVVTDDSWIIPGLGGFPGPYMKFMNQWFSCEDWLRLTAPLADRRIVLRQVVAFHGPKAQQSFSVSLEGTLLREIRGNSHYPHLTIASFDKAGRSIAEINASGKSAIAHQHTAWHDLCEWLAKNA